MANNWQCTAQWKARPSLVNFCLLSAGHEGPHVDVNDSWPSDLEAALADRDRRIEALTKALREIEDWSRAYPLSVFPEPDFTKAAEVLQAAGMTLGSISASNMRHVVNGVGEVASRALASAAGAEAAGARGME